MSSRHDTEHRWSIIISVLLVVLAAAVVVESVQLDQRSRRRAVITCQLTADGRAAGARRSDAINAGFIIVGNFIRQAAIARAADAHQGLAEQASAKAAAQYLRDAERLAALTNAITKTNLPDPDCAHALP